MLMQCTVSLTTALNFQNIFRKRKHGQADPRAETPIKKLRIVRYIGDFGPEHFKRPEDFIYSENICCDITNLVQDYDKMLPVGNVELLF